MKVLLVTVSPNGEQSASRIVANKLIGKLKPSQVINRDLSQDPVPHITGKEVVAAFTPAEARTEEQKNLLKESDALVDELLAADTIVIATPMWNFGTPSVLKAWIDHVVRAGRTFAFTDKGLVGYAAGKKVYVIMSSGSVFSSGPFAPMDALSLGIKSFLSFIGITDVEMIRVEGTNDPKTRDNAIENALNNI